MKHFANYWVYSDILEAGAYAQTIERAIELLYNYIAAGGVDAKIKIDKWEF